MAFLIKVQNFIEIGREICHSDVMFHSEQIRRSVLPKRSSKIVLSLKHDKDYTQTFKLR